MQTIYSLTGDRIKGDPANDFIAGCYDKMGDDVITTAIQYDEYEPVAEKAGSFKAKSLNVWLIVLTTVLETVVLY